MRRASLLIGIDERLRGELEILAFLAERHERRQVLLEEGEDRLRIRLGPAHELLAAWTSDRLCALEMELEAERRLEVGGGGEGQRNGDRDHILSLLKRAAISSADRPRASNFTRISSRCRSIFSCAWTILATLVLP